MILLRENKELPSKHKQKNPQSKVDDESEASEGYYKRTIGLRATG